MENINWLVLIVRFDVYTKDYTFFSIFREIDFRKVNVKGWRWKFEFCSGLSGILIKHASWSCIKKGLKRIHQLKNIFRDRISLEFDKNVFVTTKNMQEKNEKK